MSTTAATLAGVTPQIAQPTDVFEFVAAARRDLSGTDYPGALDLGKALLEAYSTRASLPRERRLFAALWVVALEGDDDQAHAAKHDLVEMLSDVDLKAL